MEKTFVPRTIIDKAQEQQQRDETGFEQPGGNAAWADLLTEMDPILSVAMVGENQVFLSHVLCEGGLVPIHYLDQKGVVTEGDAKTQVVEHGTVTGDEGVLVNRDVCGPQLDCRNKLGTMALFLQNICELAVDILTGQLQDQARRLLSESTALSNACDIFGALASSSATALFTAAAAAIGGPVSALVGEVGVHVAQGVSNHVKSYASTQRAGEILSEGQIRAFFAGYVLGWTDGMADVVAKIEYASDEEVEIAVQHLAFVVHDQERTVDAMMSAALAAFLSFGATTTDATDAFGDPNGVYNFLCTYSGAVDAPILRQIGFPTGITNAQADLLLSEPALFDTQAFKFCNDDRTIVGYAQPGRQVSEIHIDPTRHRELQRLALGSQEQLDRLLRRSLEDEDAKKQLDDAVLEGLTLLWQNIRGAVSPAAVLPDLGVELLEGGA